MDTVLHTAQYCTAHSTPPVFGMFDNHTLNNNPEQKTALLAVPLHEETNSLSFHRGIDCCYLLCFAVAAQQMNKTKW